MKISGYDIIKKLGEGSSAAVWKAHQVSLDRIVAIKILKEHLCRDAEEVQDFISEARSAAQLKHPNLIQVFDVAHKENQHYFVMEHIDGPTIRQLLDKRGAISQKNALKIVRNVAEALKSAWEQANLIHRDIKPENIMIDSDGTTKLADLGLAKRVDPVKAAQRAADGYVAGSPNYMSPEQAAGSAKLDTRTDMYCLGATLYHMVTGRMPFADDSTAEALNKHITDYLPNPRAVNVNVSVSTARLIAKLMMKAPSDRYADWDKALEDIKKASSGKTTTAGSEPSGRSTIGPLKGGTPRVGKKPAGAVAASAAASTAAATGAVAAAAQAAAPLSTVPPTDKLTPLSPAARTKRPRSKKTAPAGKPTGKKPAAGKPTAKKPAAKKPPAKPIPKPVKVFAWSILCTWWAALAFLLFAKPEIIRGLLPNSAPYLPDAPPAKTEIPPPPEPEINIEPDTDVQPLVPPNGSTTQPPTPDPVQQQKPAAPLLTDLKTRLAGDLALQDFQQALATLDVEAKDKKEQAELDEIAKLREFVTEVSKMDETVRATFTAQAGKTIVLNYKNRRLQIELRAVSGNNITGLLLVKTAQGVEKKPIKFLLSRLEPLERARWLGPANTPARCAMKYILHLKGGDKATAKTYAANCGPLATAFAEHLNQKVPE